MKEILEEGGRVGEARERHGWGLKRDGDNSSEKESIEQNNSKTDWIYCT